MNEVESMGFFIISIMTVLAVAVGFGITEYMVKHRAKKAKEEKELEEARKMFEQRIALKPKHMGARLSQVGNVNFEGPQQFEVLDD